VRLSLQNFGTDGEAITFAAILVPGEKSNHQINADLAIAAVMIE
jgi:hypothetical protein